MCDKNNAEEIVSEMLTYLETADYSIKEEMVIVDFLGYCLPSKLMALFFVYHRILFTILTKLLPTYNAEVEIHFFSSGVESGDSC